MCTKQRAGAGQGALITNFSLFGRSDRAGHLQFLSSNQIGQFLTGVRDQGRDLAHDHLRSLHATLLTKKIGLIRICSQHF